MTDQIVHDRHLQRMNLSTSLWRLRLALDKVKVHNPDSPSQRDLEAEIARVQAKLVELDGEDAA